jgi:hypothetical protein
MTRKFSLVLIVLFLLSIIVGACGGIDQDTEIAVIVALTQTASASQPAEVVANTPEQAIAEPSPTISAPPVPVSGYQPYGSCTDLNAFASADNGLTGTLSSPVPFTDYITGQNGTACQIVYSTTNAALPADADPFRATISMLTTQGWVEDMNYGAGGATGLSTAFRKDSTLCFVSYERRPIDRALCSSDEPIGSCFEKLAPEQIIYTLTLTCSTYFP